LAELLIGNAVASTTKVARLASWWTILALRTGIAAARVTSILLANGDSLA
jgi:hypothetical protein